MNEKKVTDEQILEALKKNGGFIQMAADALGITRQCLWVRLKDNPELTEAKEQLRQGNLDLAESQLLKQVKKGYFPAIKHMLNCLARDRGYEERQKLDVESKEDVHLYFLPAGNGGGEQHQ